MILGVQNLRFSCDDNVKAAVHQWLCAQPKTFFADGVKKLVRHCVNCIAEEGDHVEIDVTF